MDTRMKELADFCKKQMFDEKVRQQYENADDDKSFSLLFEWDSMSLWVFDGPDEDEVEIRAYLSSAEDKGYYVFECIKECMKKEYDRELQFVGEYSDGLNAVILHFLPKKCKNLQNLYVTILVPKGQMNQLCTQLNALMK